MKKIISLFTTLSIVFSMLGTFTVFAEDSAADLEIGTLTELEAFRDDINNGNTYEGKTVKLTADIDMSSHYGKYAMSWIPIGTFAGTFDGANHAIIGLYINNTDEYNVALFSAVDGTIKNLNVKGSVLSTSMGNEAAGITSSNNGSIINCAFDGTVECPHYSAAGIAAENWGVIENCKVSGKIIGEHNVGGFSGFSNGEFINCINEAEIIGWAPVGGIASAGYECKFINCINKGSITARPYIDTDTDDESGEETTNIVESFSIGGIVGETSYMSTIENCYNTGAISGNSDVGGIIGVSGGSSENLLQVKNCYNIGNITSTMENDGEHNIGAIIGNREFDYTEDYENFTKVLTSEAVNCYYLVGTADKGCGGNADDTATALTTEQFADKSNFANWDFDTVWEMDANLGRPVLRSNTEDTDEVIEISTLEELEAFRDDVNSGNTYATKTVKLTADIDMSGKYCEGKESWTPIGIDSYPNSKPFSGIFDGGNHTINGLYINTETMWSALFELVNGTIKNLNVKGSVLTTNQNGNSAGIAAVVWENGAITDCSFDGISESPQYVAAGIVSDNSGLISDCKFNGQVIGIHLTAGIASRNYGTITNCINEGEITATTWGGGILAGGSGTVTNCVNKGNVKGMSLQYEFMDEPEISYGIGGIVGIMSIPDGVIENCYNIGAVSGNSEVGGILGAVVDWSAEVGSPVTVKNCYNIGNVTSTLENSEEHYIGGVIGNVECEHWDNSSDQYVKVIGGEAINCYYLTDTADKGMAVVGEGGTDTTTALTTEQFTDKSNFANWNFDTVWEMDATLGRPVLRSGTEEPPIETHTHTLVHHAAVDATCTETGMGEYWKCEGTDACNKMFSDADGTTEIAEIPTTAATGHSYGEWSITTEPTFDKTGKADRICGNDNTHKEIVNLPILTDTTVWTEDLKIEPTETEKGLIIYTSRYGNVQIIIPAFRDATFTYEITGLVLRDSDTLPENSDFVVKYTITQVAERNTNEYDKFFVAAYDTDGKLICVSSKNVKMSVGQIIHLGYLIEPNGKKVGSIKAFAWDGFNSMKPLAETKTLFF